MLVNFFFGHWSLSRKQKTAFLCQWWHGVDWKMMDFTNYWVDWMDPWTLWMLRLYPSPSPHTTTLSRRHGSVGKGCLSGFLLSLSVGHRESCWPVFRAVCADYRGVVRVSSCWPVHVPMENLPLVNFQRWRRLASFTVFSQLTRGSDVKHWKICVNRVLIRFRFLQLLFHFTQTL